MFGALLTLCLYSANDVMSKWYYTGEISFSFHGFITLLHCLLCDNSVSGTTLAYSIVVAWFYNSYLNMIMKHLKLKWSCNRDHPRGRHGRGGLTNCPTSPLFKLGEKWFYTRYVYIERIAKDYHFSSKLLKMVKTSPCFKFVDLSLCKLYLTGIWLDFGFMIIN